VLLSSAGTQTPNRHCAQAASMPEGRADRAVGAAAESMDGAEHSGRIERVPVGARICRFHLRQISRPTETESA
jgi:hypothetical protein